MVLRHPAHRAPASRAARSASATAAASWSTRPRTRRATASVAPRGSRRPARAASRAASRAATAGSPSTGPRSATSDARRPTRSSGTPLQPLDRRAARCRARPVDRRGRGYRQDDAGDARLEGRRSTPGASVAIYSLPRLLNLLRESLESPGGLIDLLDRLAAVDLLHIDDLGAENQTEWVLEQLYSIVNARYEAERAIVTTSNLMPDELSDRLGARTVSRLEEICGEPIPLFGEDRRQAVRGPKRSRGGAGRRGRAAPARRGRPGAPGRPPVSVRPPGDATQGAARGVPKLHCLCRES